MTLLVMAAAGAVFGAGLLLILRGTVLASPPPLTALLEDLYRPRQLMGLKRSPVDRWADRIAGTSTARRDCDLAVCERSTAKFVQDRFTWAVLAAAPGLSLLALSTTGAVTVFPPSLCLLAAAGGIIVGWFYALASERSDANA